MGRWSERAKGFVVGVALYALLVSVSVALAGWTTPRTWTTSELVTAAIMNTHIRDNFDFVKTTLDAHQIEVDKVVNRSRVLASEVQTRGTVGTGGTGFSSYTVPANTLSANGDALRVTVFGAGADTANVRQLVLYLGSDGVDLALGAGTYWQGVNWRVTVDIIRYGGSLQAVNFLRSPDGGVTTNLVGHTTFGQTLTNALTLQTVGVSAGGNNDLQQYGWSVEFLPIG